jgi:glyoxylase-like metal-dependent hydrolase (beta-lactamase superfamily II)
MSGDRSVSAWIRCPCGAPADFGWTDSTWHTAPVVPPCVEYVSRPMFRKFQMRHPIWIFLMFWWLTSAFAQNLDWCKSQPRSAYSKLEKLKTPDPWFEVYKIRPGVIAIYEPHQFEEVISYLVIGTQKALLFDTGMGISNIKAVVEGLTSLPVSVVNSHTHNDHVGDNWRFTDVYGMPTEFTRRNAKGSTADAQAELAPGQICGPLPTGFDAKSYRTRPFHISHWLHDGDTISLGDRTLKVIATPGHTPDSIALLDERNALLFTGDTFYLGPIYLYRPETDLDAYVLSIQRLAELAPRLQLLLPAHNVPVADPGYLPRVLDAIQQVRRGQAKSVSREGRREYVFEGFSFLMSPSFSAFSNL